MVFAALRSERVVVASKNVHCRPDAVRRHVEHLSKGLPPFGQLERFTPVVRGVCYSSVSQVGNGDVPIDATVAVVRAPFDYEGAAAGMSSTYRELKAFEVGLDLADASPSLDCFTALWPLTYCVIGEPNAQNPLEPG